MKQKAFIQKIIYFLFLFFAFLLLELPLAGNADQAGYFYDNLGRLAGVTDGQGNISIYYYDPVGNLLSIQRYTPATSGIGIVFLFPDNGTPGTRVEIRGYGFDLIASNNQVSFNGVPATVISSTANSIITSVPNNATTGPITVANSRGTATSPNPFTVLYLPVIQKIDPSVVAQGTTNFVVITGFHMTNAISVSFPIKGLNVSYQLGKTETTLPIMLTVAPDAPVGTYSFIIQSSLGVVQSGTVTVTVKPPSPDSSTALPISVFMPLSGQIRPTGPESVSAPGLSVFVPPSANQSPSGPESIGTAPLSVFLPSLMNPTLSGLESIATLPLSIYIPMPNMVSPSGSLTVVSPPESILMP